MADIQKISRGRKFFVVKWLLVMWFVNFGSLVALGVLEVNPIPQSLGISLATISGGIVGYIGVNVWQKKVETPKPEAP